MGVRAIQRSVPLADCGPPTEVKERIFAWGYRTNISAVSQEKRFFVEANSGGAY